jgi:hypothetical protein
MLRTPKSINEMRSGKEKFLSLDHLALVSIEVDKGFGDGLSKAALRNTPNLQGGIITCMMVFLSERCERSQRQC